MEKLAKLTELPLKFAQQIYFKSRIKADFNHAIAVVAVPQIPALFFFEPFTDAFAFENLHKRYLQASKLPFLSIRVKQWLPTQFCASRRDIINVITW